MRALVFVVLVACGGNAVKPAAPPTEPPSGEASNEAKLAGTITQIDFGCAADARCELVLDGKTRVRFGHGSRGEGPQVWGNSDELFALMEAPNQGVGRKVEVFAAKQDDGYTLQGKEAYYVKVLP